MVPFLITKTGGSPQLNFARIMEAVIIGIIASIAASYISVARIEVKLEFMQNQIEKNYANIEKNRDVLNNFRK